MGAFNININLTFVFVLLIDHMSEWSEGNWLTGRSQEGVELQE